MGEPISFNPWFDEVRQALMEEFPERDGEFTKSEIVDKLWDLKDVDKRTGNLLYDKFYKMHYPTVLRS